MKVGLISDVHANLPALDAVLEDMPAVDELVCAGDIVGYGAWPVECLERVREVASVTVQGNHDRTVETPQRYSDNEMAEAGLEHAKRVLDEEQLEWLATLPKRREIADGAYLLVHSHPDPDHLGTYVRPKDFPQLRPHLDEYEGLVLGHTHLQYHQYVDDRLVVNPGSVGQPRDRNPKAAYGVLDTERNTVELRRVLYSLECAQRGILDEGLPETVAERLAYGE